MPQYLLSVNETSAQNRFSIIKNTGSTDDLIRTLYVDPSPKTIQHFKSVNRHLGPTVRPGRIAIITPPDSLTCSPAETEMQAFALQVDQQLQAMDAEEAEIAARYHELLGNIIGYSNTSYGISMNYFKQHKLQIEQLLKQIETLYVKTYNTQGGLKQADFLTRRRALFRQLDKTLENMFGHSLVGPDIQSGKIKHSLGLSTKSILHQWKRQNATVTNIPGYADNHIKIGRMAKTIKHAGYVGLSLDLAYSGVNIHQACTVGTENGNCARTSFREGGRLIGSVGGGAAGGALAGYLACNLLFALPSAGTSTLWCGIVAGGIGGYLGGSILGEGMSRGGEILYENTYKLKDKW